MEALHAALVVPLYDVLMWLYGTVAFGNLGVAVIELTVLLRLLLLPLTIIEERKRFKYDRLTDEVQRIQESFKNDPVEMHERIRDLLKRNRVNHWANAVVLLIQLVVLVVLYRVFITGIHAGEVNTLFFGFDISQRNFWWSLAVGVLLYLEIVLEQRQVEKLLGKQDAVFRYAFPLVVVVVLSFLPMVKSLFILTSMAFSASVSFIRRKLWPTA